MKRGNYSTDDLPLGNDLRTFYGITGGCLDTEGNKYTAPGFAWADSVDPGALCANNEGGTAMSKGWIGRPSPKSMHVGTGWFAEMNRCYTDQNRHYAVMIRTVDTEWGKVEHVCIRNTESTDIPWAEKQRIKNEIIGNGRTAIEVFPAETDLVDKANMYHLWVLPENMKLPFTIKTEVG